MTRLHQIAWAAVVLVLAGTSGCSPYGYGTTPWHEARRQVLQTQQYPLVVYPEYATERRSMLEVVPPEIVLPGDGHDHECRCPCCTPPTP